MRNFLFSFPQVNSVGLPCICVFLFSCFYFLGLDEKNEGKRNGVGEVLCNCERKEMMLEGEGKVRKVDNRLKGSKLYLDHSIY